MRFSQPLAIGYLIECMQTDLPEVMPNAALAGVASLGQAKADELSYFYDESYAPLLELTKAKWVIAPLGAQLPEGMHGIFCTNPKLAVAKLLQTILPPIQVAQGVHPTAVVGERTTIDPSVVIGPYAIIGNDVTLERGVQVGAHTVIGDHCVIGAETILYPRVTLYAKTRMGVGCMIHSGTVIGSDGFGYANDQGEWVKLPHLGGVKLGNELEIGANTTIDRGMDQDTVLEDGVIIDNQVQIGHNVHIGRHTAIAGCVGIAGSAKIGNYCLIGGGSKIGGHLMIVDGTQIAGGTSVSRSINKKGVYSSAVTACENQVWKRNLARLHGLDNWVQRLLKMEKNLKKITKSEE